MVNEYLFEVMFVRSPGILSLYFGPNDKSLFPILFLQMFSLFCFDCFTRKRKPMLLACPFSLKFGRRGMGLPKFYK